MGNRGFVELHNEQGLNIVTLAMILVFAIVIVGSIMFKLKVDQDQERRRAIRESRKEQTK